MQIIKEKYDYDSFFLEHIRYGYYKDGEFVYHNNDGPSVICEKNSSSLWFYHGALHRLDGPACEYGNGHNFHFINGISYSENEYPEAVEAYKLSLICK